jgi:hypothetical protein
LAVTKIISEVTRLDVQTRIALRGMKEDTHWKTSSTLEMVIDQVHEKTFRGDLEWRSSGDSVRAEPTPAIVVGFKFYDDGPDSAVWEYVYVTHPVGKDMTMLGNPASTKTRLIESKASGKTLVKLDDLFRHVLLEPRKKQFEDAMKELRK